MSLTAEDVASIVSAVIEALDERRSMTLEQHDADHRFVQEMAAERRERTQLWREMRIHLAKLGAIGALTALGVMSWYYISHAVIPQSIGVPHG